MQCGGDFEPSAAYEQVSDGEGDERAAGGQDACGALPVEGLSVEAVAFGGVELAEGGCVVAGGFAFGVRVDHRALRVRSVCGQVLAQQASNVPVAGVPP